MNLFDCPKTTRQLAERFRERSVPASRAGRELRINGLPVFSTRLGRWCRAANPDDRSLRVRWLPC